MTVGILSRSKVNTHSWKSYQCIWHGFSVPELPPIPTSRLVGFRYSLSREVRSKESMVECSYEADQQTNPSMAGVKPCSKMLLWCWALHMKKEVAGFPARSLRACVHMASVLTV